MANAVVQQKQVADLDLQLVFILISQFGSIAIVHVSSVEKEGGNVDLQRRLHLRVLGVRD